MALATGIFDQIYLGGGTPAETLAGHIAFVQVARR